MLDYLERSDIFRPEVPSPGRHGKHRNYTFRDLVVLRAINRLLELGSRLKRIKQAISTFAVLSQIPNSEDELLAFARSSSRFLVEKDRIIFCEDDQALVDLLGKGQLTFSFMVDVKSTMQPVVLTIREYQKYRPAKADARRALLDKIARSHGL